MLIRAHLDYGDNDYDQAYNVSFHQNLEFIHYNSKPAITGLIKRTSREKLYLLNSLKVEDGIISFVALIKFLRISHLDNYLMSTAKWAYITEN